MKRSRKVLVTGGSGLLGRPLVERLAAGDDEVHAVARHVPASSPAGVIWHAADLLEPAARVDLVEKVRPDALHHLAWECGPGTSNDEVNERWLEASRDLLDRFVEAGGREVLVAGSCFEYAWGDEPCVEDETPLDASTRYGRCKRDFLEHLRRRAEADGLTWHWGRIFFTYGPHEHPRRLVSSIILSLLRGERAECTHGRQLRDYLHSDDVAAALHALDAADWSGVCNIASGAPVTLAEIGRTAAEIIGRPDLLALGARPAPDHEPPRILADTRRLFDRLGWRPSLDLRAGLEATVASWREEIDRVPS